MTDWIEIGKRKIDRRFLEERPVSRCEIKECGAACCGHGVHVDLAHATRIVEEAESIKPYLPADRHDVDNWFDGDVGEDSDYPTGLRVGTQVIDDATHPAGTRCIFLRPDNFCALQVTSLANGKHPWDLKPYYCALFPVVVLGNEVVFDDDNEIYKVGGTCQKGCDTPAPLYRIFKEELVLALGETDYERLCQIAAS
jgi:hypothetical protein